MCIWIWMPVCAECQTISLTFLQVAIILCSSLAEVIIGMRQPPSYTSLRFYRTKKNCSHLEKDIVISVNKRRMAVRQVKTITYNNLNRPDYSFRNN